MEDFKSLIPLVSVVIPTYKRSCTILDSIQSVLNQTYKNIEIIVVDDNGRGTEFQKRTEIVLKSHIENGNIKYIVHEVNRNGSVARNTGFMCSRGEYINFLDDDDKFYPEKIEKQVQRLMNTDENVGATYCNSITIRNRTFSNKLYKRESNLSKEGNLCREYLLGKVLFNTSTILFKRKALETIGGFDGSFTRHQDYEIMIRFFRKYNIVCTSLQPLVIYDQTSDRINKPNCEKDFLMKEKLLSVYASDFENMGAKSEISYHFWMLAARNAASKRKLRYVFKSLNLCLKYGRINLIEIIILFKILIISEINFILYLFKVNKNQLF